MPFLRVAARRPSAAATRRIIHVIGTLGPGGAERQLCYLATAQARRGYDVKVMLLWEPVGEHGHYLPLLQHEGITACVAGAEFDPGVISALQSIAVSVRRLPSELQPAAIDLFGEFRTCQPDLVHAWLDSPNISAGIAAVLAGVPRIVLSTRNVNPTHFPNLSRPYYRRAYQALTAVPGVELINNSRNGADDYAEWLGLDRARISVVLNGLDVTRMPAATTDEVQVFRRAHNLPVGVPIVAGVFRLAEEKQPHTFLDVIERVIMRVPRAVAVLAGIGPLEDELRARVAAARLQDRVRFLGRVPDVRALYATSAVTLLCSRQEGTPNVLLEAQWFGCPVVATRAGGAVDIVADHVSGYLLPVGDVDGLTAATIRLLEDEALRQQLAGAAPEWVRTHFSVERMTRETLAVYGDSDGC
jgi:glycosyltransferase involved in cell wall biosynthesis